MGNLPPVSCRLSQVWLCPCTETKHLPCPSQSAGHFGGHTASCGCLQQEVPWTATDCHIAKQASWGVKAGLLSFVLISPLILQEEEAFDSYVLITQQDALEAMGCFVAAYLATLPDAQKMEPQELQKALVNSFKVSHLPSGPGRRPSVCSPSASGASKLQGA